MDTVPGWYSPTDDAAADEPAAEWTSCPTCGTANTAEARFCQACGRPFVEPEPDPLSVPVLTAVVCELVTPTDAFALPDDVEDRSSIVRASLVSAGGELHELPGSQHTVAAVFGPQRRDGDETLRAVTAAVSARDAIASGAVALRVGVGASDVLGDGAEATALWRGRVVDLAVRLQRMASAGEIILGEGAYRLVRTAVEADPVDPRADPSGVDVGPLRLRAVLAPPGETPLPTEVVPQVDAEPRAGETEAGPTEIERVWEASWEDPMRSTAAGQTPVEDAPEAEGAPIPQAEAPAGPTEASSAPPEPAATGLLGREPFLAALHEALDEAIRSGGPVVRTLGGQPGSGRTSLTRWFAGQTAERTWTVDIACPPPETGGTAWPFAPIVRALAGVEAADAATDVEDRLRTALEGEAGAEGDRKALAAYLARDGGGAPVAETRAAIAHLLAATAARRPLVVIVDDADRASVGFRAALEAILASVDAPVFTVLVVGPGADLDVPHLPEDEAAELVERLLAHPNLPPDAIAAIVGACGGDPLAIEHLVAMLADDGHLRWEYGRWTPSVDLASLPLPADLRSLVARRIGGLADHEREIAAVAAIAGEAFDAAMLADALGTDVATVDETLGRLVDRGILRRGDRDTFAFSHDMIQETAARYAARPAARRMHEASADRLVAGGIVGPDIDEAIGAHLEQAYRLAASDPGREAIGRRAAEHLARAASGAADVGDEDGWLALLRRAAADLPTHDAARAQLLLDSAVTLAARDERGAAERLLGDAVRAARVAGDELLEHRATVVRASMLATSSRIEDQIEALRDASEAAIGAARRAGDPVTSTIGWSARGWVAAIRGHWAGAADAYERAADAAAAAGRRRDELVALRELAGAIVDGPAPVAESIERCRALVERVRGTGAEPAATATLAVLLARSGRTAEARERSAAFADVALDAGDVAAVRSRLALVETHAGSLPEAETLLRHALGADLTPTQRGALDASLAHILVELGRPDEATEVAEHAASLADEDDAPSQVTWRAAKARCLAAAHRDADARALVRLALRLADQTDLSELRARTRLDLAEVLLASGRSNEAGPAARAALRALECKGSVPEAARARAILDRVVGRTPETPGGKTEASSAEPSTPTASRDEPPEQPTSEGPEAARVMSPSEAEAPDEGERRERHWFW